MTEQVAVIGTGLIGGSIALGLRSGQPELLVSGYDADPDALAAAVACGAIGRPAPSAASAVKGAGLVVVATPVDAIADVCRDLAGAVSPEAVITDVGSAKREAVANGEDVFGDRFVGGHPMAGSERHGVGAADAGLFDAAWWILTPTSTTSADAYSRVARLASGLGAKPVAVDAVVHDALVARLSHVPQLTASALVDVAAATGDRDALLELAGPGFRDVTRIAASSPDLWIAILRSNREAVLEALDGLRGRLHRIAGMIAEEHWAELRAFLESSRRARLGLFAKPEYGGPPVTLSFMVPDRPGVFAQVTTAAGELGANIEDLRVVHSTEGGGGRLELVITGEDRADELTEALTILGYRVERSAGSGDMTTSRLSD